MGFYNKNYTPYTWQMNVIYNYLGKYLYSILDEVELPKGHITLNSSILLLVKGYKLPTNHKSLEDIIKDELQ